MRVCACVRTRTNVSVYIDVYKITCVRVARTQDGMASGMREGTGIRINRLKLLHGLRK